MSILTDVRTVLFDLDGTLADTAGDLGYALNVILTRHGQEALPPARVRPYASNGSAALIELGFGPRSSVPNFEELREALLAVYEQNLTRATKLFDGMDTVLSELDQRGLQWGVVTNKPARFTEPLISQLGLIPRCHCVVSGDQVKRSKPAPDSLLLACKNLGTQPAQCVYVGDAPRDIDAGKAAGMRTIAARYGYIMPGDKPEKWKADVLIDQPEDLLALLGD
jgi:phosphoglycolate phosphatase